MNWLSKKTEKDFISALDASLSGAAKKSAELGGSVAGSKLAQALGYAASQHLYGPIAGAAFGALIEALLKNADESKKMLRLLKSEPYITGTRELKFILDHDHGIYKSEHTNRRLEFVIDKLSEALTYSVQEDDYFRQLYLYLLIGICESKLSEKPNFAIGRFAKALIVLDRLIEELEVVRKKFGGYMPENVRLSDIAVYVPGQRMAGITWFDPQKVAKKHNEQLRGQERKIKDYRKFRKFLDQFIAYTK